VPKTDDKFKKLDDRLREMYAREAQKAQARASALDGIDALLPPVRVCSIEQFLDGGSIGVSMRGSNGREAYVRFRQRAFEKDPDRGRLFAFDPVDRSMKKVALGGEIELLVVRWIREALASGDVSDFRDELGGCLSALQALSRNGEATGTR